ncbi:DUF1844 domain-containing protein [candidate division WOR-3 bacterium]|nr:DUF1844 domain-containing protein [candidate division WOR-3 bacterium]
MDNKNTLTIMDVVSPFYTQALMHLGVMKLPDMDIKTDLNLAKQSIDLIRFIETKTKNNLTEQENKTIQDILTNAQVLFVETEKKEINKKSSEREEK